VVFLLEKKEMFDKIKEKTNAVIIKDSWKTAQQH